MAQDSYKDTSALSDIEETSLALAQQRIEADEQTLGYGDFDEEKGGSTKSYIKLFRSLRQYTRSTLLTPVLMVGEVVMEVLIPSLMAVLIDRGIQSQNMSEVWRWGILLVCAALVSLSFGVAAGYTSAHASAGFAKNLRHDLFAKVQDFSFTNIDRFSAGSLVTRLTTDVSNVQFAFQMLIRIAFRAPVMALTAWVFTYRISPSISLIYLVIMPILVGALLFIASKVHPLFVRVFSVYDRLNINVEEILKGVRVVKSFTREKYENTKFKRISQGIYDTFVKAELPLAYNMPLLQGSIYIAMLAISWMTAHQIVASGNNPDMGLTTGDLTSLITYTLQILMSMMMISFAFVMIIISRASASRIEAVLDEKPTVSSPAEPLMEVADGSVRFKDVTFRYSETAESDVLSHIDVEIPSGSTVGIVGGTGSAKSSLVQLIPRLYDVTSGSVRLGGRDVRNYDLNVLRDAVGMVLQKNVLFTGTVAENLRWGNPDATDEDIAYAAHLACADEFIEKMADGYNSHVEQGGTNFSGGQRQRLCIARALLKKPKVLILDDSTSAVDTKTDARIREAFATEIPDTTKIIIAQRISSIEHADQILVMDNGHIMASGTHAELMETCEEYRNIANSQAKGGAISE